MPDAKAQKEEWLWPTGLDAEQVSSRARGLVLKKCRFLRGDRLDDAIHDVVLGYLQGRRGYFVVELFRSYLGRHGNASKGCGEREIPLSTYEDQRGETDWMPETPSIEQDHAALELADVARDVELIAAAGEGSERGGGERWWRRLAPAWLGLVRWQAAGYTMRDWDELGVPVYTEAGVRVRAKLLSEAGVRIRVELRAMRED